MDFFYYLIKISVIALQIVKEFNPYQESDAQVGTYTAKNALEKHLATDIRTYSQYI
jgi:predicted methyltransferase